MATSVSGADVGGPQDELVAAFFHQVRSRGKRRPIAGEDKITAAIFKRMHEVGTIDDETYASLLKRLGKR